MPGNKEKSSLESLQQLSLLLGTTLDLQQESAAFMQWLAENMQLELAALFLSDESREHLELAGSLGFQANDTRLALGLDPWEWLKRQDLELPLPGDPCRQALPLTAEGELLGLLAFVCRPESAPKETEILLAEVAAGFFALHLRNIYRHRNIEQLVEERTAELSASEVRFRMIFEESPVALLEVNLSRLREKFTMLREQGVKDLRLFLQDHPHLLAELVQKIRLLKINRAALRLFGCATKKELFSFFREAGPQTLGEEMREAFLQFFWGERKFAGEVTFRNRQGEQLHAVMQLLIPPPSLDTWEQVFISLQDITERVQSQQKLQESYRRLQHVLEGSVRSLAALTERRDPYTAGHQQRVADLACAIARELGFSEERMRGLQIAAFLHDIGKIAVPAEILTKPSRLSELEFALLKGHPQTGYEILSGIDFPWPVAEMVYQHHERLDGSGYPRGLKGKEILLEAQILAVADVVEAMASHRPYRPAHTIEDALEEIKRNEGLHYSPAVVQACLELFSSKKFAFER